MRTCGRSTRRSREGNPRRPPRCRRRPRPHPGEPGRARPRARRLRCTWPGPTMTTARQIPGSSPVRPGAALSPSRWPKACRGVTARQVAERAGRPADQLATRAAFGRRQLGGGPRHARNRPALTLRLIGTSHGHGRLGFPHTSAELPEQRIPGSGAPAVDLFDGGSWDELIEATHIRYGVWGCAYLEAVLRAADCQISAEGK